MTDPAPPDLTYRETSNPAGGALPQIASVAPGAPVSLSSAGAPTPKPGLWAWLDGRKTYLVVLLGVVYVLGADLGWWPYDDLVLAILGFGGMGALRHGLPKTTR